MPITASSAYRLCFPFVVFYDIPGQWLMYSCTPSITSDEKKYLNEINFSTDIISENAKSTEKAKQIKTQVKTKNINELKEG